jgi:hypothetical protein
MLPKYNNVNETKQSESLALDLETLNAKYNNLLVRYKQATIDYLQNLKIEAARPCGKYTANSTGVSEQCYQDLWAKTGCTTGIQDPAATWYPKQTLNTLISDSWAWSTMTDNQHRMGCYGSNVGPYMIIGVGTDGYLYSKTSLTALWVKINDDSNGNIHSICTGNDGKTIICSNINNEIWTKTSWDSSNWQGPIQNSCCITGVAMGQDGSVLGVGLDNKIWIKSDLNANWVQNPDQGEWLIDICIGPDNSLFCTNGGGLFKKDNYTNLSVPWTYLGDNTCCVKSITIAPDGTFIGVANDGTLVTKTSYKDLTTPWSQEIEGSCCVKSITTIVNPNYNPTMYNTTSQPNYNLEAPPLTSLQGTTFWGTIPLTQINGGTLQDCMASCSNTSNCTGATYNQYDHGQPMCWLRGGEGNITPGLEGDYAIVPKSKELLQVVNSINEELTNLNKQIQLTIEKVTNVYGRQSLERNLQNNNLINQNEQLQKEREIVNKMIQKYQSLDHEQNESSLYITKNYYMFYILIFIAIIGCIVLAMYSLDKKITDNIKSNVINSATEASKIGSLVNPYYLMLGIILVILVVYIYNEYSQNVYSGILSLSKKMSKRTLFFIIVIIVVVAITLNYLQPS